MVEKGVKGCLSHILIVYSIYEIHIYVGNKLWEDTRRTVLPSAPMIHQLPKLYRSEASFHNNLSDRNN